MRRRKNSKIMLGLLVAIVALGVGYALVSGVNLIINGSARAVASSTQADFKVHFDELTSNGNYITYTETAEEDSFVQSFVDEYNVTAASGETDKAAGIVIDSTTATEATISVSNLTTIGDTVTFTIPVINESEGIKADLSATVTNASEEYFNVVATPAVETLNDGATTTLTVTVSVVKVPKVNDVTGTFTVTLTADPTE